MDVRRLQYFIAVAEEMSFSRAAERLMISQPPLSQQIRILENELGCQLFDRSHRAIRLTASGEVLLKESKFLLARHEAVAKLVSQVSVAGETLISLGLVNSALVGLAPAILNWVRNNMPLVHLELREVQSGAQFDQISQDRIDIGLLRAPEPPQGFRRIGLPKEPLWLAVPTDHRFAEQSSVGFAELAGESVILYARHLAPAEFDNLIGQSHRHGFHLRITHEINSGGTLLPRVAAGEGVTPVSRLATGLSMDGVVFRPILPIVHATPLAVFTRVANSNVAIDALVDAIVDIAAETMRAE